MVVKIYDHFINFIPCSNSAAVVARRNDSPLTVARRLQKFAQLILENDAVACCLWRSFVPHFFFFFVSILIFSTMVAVHGDVFIIVDDEIAW